jgi:hypothetical protein
MKARHIALLAGALVAAALLLVGSSSAAPIPVGAPASSVLSSQSDLGTSTVAIADDGSGVTSITSDIELDTADTTATMGSDGYLCGNAGYKATVRGTDFWGFVDFTYRETFVVAVCHDKVQSKVHLYDEPVDSNFGWTWCGHIVNQFTMNPNNASAIGYTKGCFTVLVKGLVQTKYPWGSMTIGGNGNLWVRKTGLG